MVDVGDVLAGKYRVERVLGRGGMGYVVSAYHEALGQHVAVKFMMPELCEREEPVTRFLREARAAVRIRNEHVARVLDVGTLESGAPYMVMEYLEGHDLADELDRRVQFPTYEAVDYVLQAAEAIAEAHALGIVHRDLKPANLFLTRRFDGTALVKVLDFGISKALVDETGQTPVASLTATQALIGSPQYMSPEQVRKPKTVDGRSDVWALGVILYELLAGRQPFSADTAMSVLAAVVSDPTPSIRPIRPDVPAELEAVIFKCLEKKPEERYQTVAEFAQALEPFAPPTAVHSIQRISGTLRSMTPARIPSNTPTEASSEGKTPPPPLMLPDADTVQATPESLPGASRESLAELRSADSKTAATWGKSTKPGDVSPKKRWYAPAAGAAIGLVVAGAFVLSATRRGETPAAASLESAVPSAPQGSASAPADSHPTRETSSEVPDAAPIVAPADPSQAPPHVEKPPPKPTHKPPITSGPVKTPPVVSAPSAASVSPVHPLEGRR